MVEKINEISELKKLMRKNENHVYDSYRNEYIPYVDKYPFRLLYSRFIYFELSVLELDSIELIMKLSNYVLYVEDEFMIRGFGYNSSRVYWPAIETRIDASGIGVKYAITEFKNIYAGEFIEAGVVPRMRNKIIKFD